MLALFAASLLFASIGDLPLESGQVLQDCKLGYRTYGRMNPDKSNVVLFPSWFNGSSADLEDHVGPRKLIDDRKYFVVTIDSLANGVSSSPSNSPSQKGLKFPKIHVRDMVEAEYILATRVLGLKRVHAVMGVSMGGMQAFQWIVSYPDFMDKAVSIVGTPKMSAKDIELWSKAVNGVHIPGLGRSQLNIPGLVLPVEDGKNEGPMPVPVGRNPFDMLKQFEAIVSHDTFKPFGGSMEKTAAAVRAKVMACIAMLDHAVSPQIPEQYIEMLKGRKVEMMSECGHTSYRCEERIIAPRIGAFLDE